MACNAPPPSPTMLRIDQVRKVAPNIVPQPVLQHRDEQPDEGNQGDDERRRDERGHETIDRLATAFDEQGDHEVREDEEDHAEDDSADPVQVVGDAGALQEERADHEDGDTGRQQGPGR